MPFVQRTYFLRSSIFFILLWNISSSFVGIKDLQYPFTNPNNTFLPYSVFSISKPFFNQTAPISTNSRKWLYTYPHHLLIFKNHHKVQKTNQSLSIIQYQAEHEIVFDALQETFSLLGPSTIQDDNTTLTANHISFNAKKQTICAEGTKNKYNQLVGNPILTYKDQQKDKYGQDIPTTTKTLFMEKLKYNIHTKRGLAHRLITKQDDAIIKTAQAKKDNDTTAQVQDINFTTCNLETPHFYIRAQNAKMVQDQYIVSGPFCFYFDNVPTPLGFCAGTLFLEGKRKHGIIPPEIGENTLGFYLRNGGYYIYFNDYVDLSMLGTIFSSGLTEFQSTLRYKKRYLCAGNIAYTHNAGLESKYWSINWKHRTINNSTRSFNSDIFLMNKPFQRISLEKNKTPLTSMVSSGTLTYCDQLQYIPYNLSIRTSYKKNHSSNFTHWILPEGTLTATYYPFNQRTSTKQSWISNINLNHTIQFENHFKNQKEDSNTKTNLNNRPWNNYTENGILHTLLLTTYFKLYHFKLTPKITYNEAWYWKKLYFNPEQQRFTPKTGFNRVYNYHIGGTLTTTLYHTQYFNHHTIKGLRIKVEPSTTLTYTPDFSKPKYGFFQERPINNNNVEKTYLFQDFLPSMPIPYKSSIIECNLHNSIELKIDQKPSSTPTEKKSNSRKIYLLKNLDFSTKYDFQAKAFKFLDGINMHIATSINQIAKIIDIDLDLKTKFDPYLLRIKHLKSNQIQEERVNILAWPNGQFLGKVKDVVLQIAINFNPKMQSNMDIVNQLYKDINDYLNDNKEELDFNTPWNFGLKFQHVAYRKNLRTLNESKYNTHQFITLDGSIILAKKWKLYGKTTYNLKDKKLDPFTEISIQRDLHCWQLSYSWNPIGENPQYDFSLRAKANILKVLNLPRKRSYNKLK